MQKNFRQAFCGIITLQILFGFILEKLESWLEETIPKIMLSILETLFIEQLYKQTSSFLLWKVLLTQAGLVLSDVPDFVRGGTDY